MTLTTPAPARRSAPESFATTAMPSTMTAPITAAVPAPSRRRVWLGGVAALTVAGVVTGVVLSSSGAPAPLPTVPAVPVAPASPVSAVGTDAATSGCTTDARTVNSRVLTAQQGPFEVPIGTLELRESAACGTAWARYTLAAAAPVAAIAIEGDTRQEVPLVARGRFAHGVTPMVGATATVRAEAVPAGGAVLPGHTLDGGTP
ncbi:DUF2690 domain-containing protein [Actinomycetospora sp. CA-084318]|uniref:DUF2690 domain-containing protein n=1 Tax=Actinomycetospora sp. CA-084318 TaxID=3239892 RepID=UPI003D969B30